MPDKRTNKELELRKIEIKIQGLKAQMLAQYELINIKLNENTKISKDTLEQAIKTNGRTNRAENDIIDLRDDTINALTEINKDIVFFNLIRRKKWFIIFIIAGTLKLYELLDIEGLFKWILSVL